MPSPSKWMQPIDYAGQYRTNTWPGYVFKEALGYASGQHTGVDYNGAGTGNADLGVPIKAVANGIVRAIVTRNDLGFGLTTIIEHLLSSSLQDELGCQSLFSRYMHQQNITVSIVQEVSVGQQIGTVGNSGTTWAHLHLDLYKNTIEGGGIHWRYDKDTELQSYLDAFEFIQSHLTEPEVQLEPYQRIVGPFGVNHREKPTTASPVVTDWKAGEKLDFRGFIRGQSIQGNDVWFVGKYDNTVKGGGALWSGSFINPNPDGLKDLTPVQPPPSPPPAPPDPVYLFEADLACVTEVRPAAIGNFQYGNFPESPRKAIIHDFGTDGVDTYSSTLNWFQNKASEIAAHFVVSGDKITQMVSLKDRAYHAGPLGNVYVGIETDPKQDDATIASTKRLLGELRNKYGYKLELIEHNTVTVTACGDDVDLTRYEIDTPQPPVSGKSLYDVLGEVEEKVTEFLKGEKYNG